MVQGVRIALVGDSTLDNALWVKSQPCLAQQLWMRLHAEHEDQESEVYLVAIDGELCSGVIGRQVENIPSDHTCRFVCWW